MNYIHDEYMINISDMISKMNMKTNNEFKNTYIFVILLIHIENETKS